MFLGVKYFEFSNPKRALCETVICENLSRGVTCRCVEEKSNVWWKILCVSTVYECSHATLGDIWRY